MKHLGTVRIETERLVLRKFTENDVMPAFYNWESDNKVTEFLQWSACTTPAETKSILEDWISSYKNNHFYQWAIILKGGKDEPIGTISVVDMNERLNSVEIGYCIGSKWWNQGITSEALSGMIPFLFNQVKVNRIEAQHDPNNPGSGKVLIKCGFKYEGTLRQADFNNKGIVDAAVYSILADDYYAKQ